MHIAIIGGGASGALAALHLARALPVGSAEIIVIEPAEEIGRGLAYSTDDPGHLLNVRAVPLRINQIICFNGSEPRDRAASA